MTVEKINISETVAPQMFAILDKEIYVFDKTNRQEGRFYKYSDGKCTVVNETQEGQGIILNSGEMYYISAGDKSTIFCLDKNGKISKSFKLDGIFYDIKLNESGNMICLGNINGLSIIKIINGEGIELSSFIPSDIIFASSIYAEGDYIYVGGFDEKYIFKVLMLNYAGVVLKKWSVLCDSNDRIINKIQKWKNKIIVSISGNEDCLVIIDSNNDKCNILVPECMKIKNTIDFNIYGDYIYILDGNCIYKYTLENLLNVNSKIKSKKAKENFQYTPYGYLINLLAVQDKLKNYFAIFCFVYTASLLLLFTSFNISSMDTFLVFSSLYWILSMCTIEVSGILLLMKKSKRIEYLLKVSKKMDIKNILVSNLFLSLMFSFVYMFFFYKSFSFLVWLFILLSVFTAFIYYSEKSINFVNNRDDIIIDLLKDDDEKINKYVKNAIESICNGKNEKLTIQITAAQDIEDGCMTNWINTRKYILGKSVCVSFYGKSIMVTIDFSNRDVRYSKFTIVMDCISYIKMFFQIKEIEIQKFHEYDKESA